MPDIYVTDDVLVHIRRYEDGRIALWLSVEALDGTIRDSMVRHYRSGTDLSDAGSDACRLLGAWSCFGLLGLAETEAALSHYAP
jgi:hypothetical protein